jgi:hypothetical protein
LDWKRLCASHAVTFLTEVINAQRGEIRLSRTAC